MLLTKLSAEIRREVAACQNLAIRLSDERHRRNIESASWIETRLNASVNVQPGAGKFIEIFPLRIIP